MTDYGGPRVGDHVQIEAAGTIVELRTRDDVPGALIELDHRRAVLWVSLEQVVVLGRRGK